MDLFLKKSSTIHQSGKDPPDAAKPCSKRSLPVPALGGMEMYVGCRFKGRWYAHEITPDVGKQKRPACGLTFLWYYRDSNLGHTDFQSVALPTEL